MLTDLIVNSGEGDQTEDNFAVVVDVFVGTAALSSNPDVIIDVPVSYANFQYNPYMHLVITFIYSFVFHRL